MRALTIALVSVLTLTACGGSSGGGDSSPPPNDPPTLTVAPGLGGGPVQFNYVLPIAGAESLTFTATDPNGDTLSWQVAVSGAGQAATGLTYSSPASGPSFTIAVEPVAAPGAATLSLLVEDPNGGAAAVDILVVRSGAPSITGVSPSSAFVSAPQPATITGSALSLQNAVNTTASFGAAAASNVVVVDDATITCTTPAPGLLGANSVSVQNAFGSDALPSGAFRMYQYPVDLFAADVPLDAGGGEQLVVASEGATIHAAWLEAGTLVHQRSLDAGATWSVAQPLSLGEVPTEVQLSVLGDQLVASWIGDGATVRAASSADGGVTFDPAVTLNVTGDPVSRPRLARAGARVYCAWLQGFAGLGEQLVHVAASPNNGGVWQPAAAISDQGVNHEGHVLGADEDAAWVAFESAPPTGAGVYTSRSDDGGFLWTAGVLRSAVSNGIGEVAVCDDGGRVSLVWTRDGQLEYLISDNSALGWQTQPSLLRPADLGAITAVTVRGFGDRLFAAYLGGGNNVAFSRVGAAGALPEHVTLSDTLEEATAPELVVSGDYLFAGWRGGDIGAGTGAARVKFATSVDVGATFTAPATFGDGGAAQDAPRLVVDGARVWFGWLDYRGVGPALYANRTQG